MVQMKEAICTGIGVVGSAIAALFGGWDAALITAGIGTPISPAFSIIDRVSLAIKAITTASRIKLEPITTSRRQATSTINRLTVDGNVWEPGVYGWEAL